jgi:hypothetical protein
MMPLMRRVGIAIIAIPSISLGNGTWTSLLWGVMYSSLPQLAVKDGLNLNLRKLKLKNKLL